MDARDTDTDGVDEDIRKSLVHVLKNENMDREAGYQQESARPTYHRLLLANTAMAWRKG